MMWHYKQKMLSTEFQWINCTRVSMLYNFHPCPGSQIWALPLQMNAQSVLNSAFDILTSLTSLTCSNPRMRRSHPCSRSRAWQEPRIFGWKCWNATLLLIFRCLRRPSQNCILFRSCKRPHYDKEQMKMTRQYKAHHVAMSRCRDVAPCFSFFCWRTSWPGTFVQALGCGRGQLCPAVSSCTCGPGHLAPSATSIASDQPRAEGYHCEMVPSNPGHDRSLFSTLLDPIGNPKQSWQILTLLEIKKKNLELIRSFCFCAQWFLVNDYYKYQGSRMCSKSRHSKDIHCQLCHSNFHLARKQQSTTVVWCGQGKVHQRAQNWHHLLNKVASFASYGESALQFVPEKWFVQYPVPT